MRALPRFEYCLPGTLEEALQLLAHYGARASILAGGTDLIVQMRHGGQPVADVVDISRLPELRGIGLDGDRLTIGSLETHSALATSPLVQRTAPALAAACRSIGSPPIRNRGTIGGNLANASPAADTAPPLLVLGAWACLVSQDGERELPLEQFFAGPGQTVLRPGELIKSFSLPIPSGRSSSVFAKLGKRNAMSCAVASAAAYVALEEATDDVLDVRLALGSVAPTPLRATEAELPLVGQRLDAGRIEAAARCAAAATLPISDVRATADYRRLLSGILIERTLADAYERAARNGGAA